MCGDKCVDAIHQNQHSQCDNIQSTPTIPHKSLSLIKTSHDHTKKINSPSPWCRDANHCPARSAARSHECSRSRIARTQSPDSSTASRSQTPKPSPQRLQQLRRGGDLAPRDCGCYSSPSRFRCRCRTIESDRAQCGSDCDGKRVEPFQRGSARSLCENERFERVSFGPIIFSAFDARKQAVSEHDQRISQANDPENSVFVRGPERLYIRFVQTASHSLSLCNERRGRVFAEQYICFGWCQRNVCLCV